MDKARELIQHPFTLLVCRWILGIVFIYASVYKIEMPLQFAKSIYNYQLIPDFAINAMAIFLPWIELFAGIGLIAGFFTPGSIRIIGGLLLIFMAAIIITLLRGIDIDCGCFKEGIGGGASGDSLEATLIRDLIYLALALPVLFSRDDKFSIDYLLKNRRIVG